MPNVVEAADAAGNSSTAYVLTVGQTVQGLLASGADRDWFAISLQAGVTYTFAMVGTGTNNVADPYLRIYGSNGAGIVAEADDGLPGANSFIRYTPAIGGTYYLDAGSFENGSAGQYGLSATAGLKESFDFLMGAGVMDSDASWSATPGTGAVVTYGFRASAAPYTVPGSNVSTFSQLSAQEIEAVEIALRMYSEICGVTFQRVNPSGTTNNAAILFANYYDPGDGASAFAFRPGSTAANAKDGDVWLNTVSISTTSLEIGSEDFATVVHEIGHALGLSHPGLYDAAPGVNNTYANDAQFIQDSQQYSMMSYFAGTNTGAGNYGTDAETPMLFDIYALQRIYGANMTTRAGDTVYGFNSNADVPFRLFGPLSPAPAFCIWDGGGIDTLDCSEYAQNQTIDLREGRFSSVKGIASNVSIAIGAVIEKAIGGTGNDTINGNDADNVLIGGLGDDSLSGNLGRDTASYASATAGVIVSLAVAQGAQQNTIGAGRDSLSGIECLLGSMHDDTLTGDGDANQIDGGEGNDVLAGGGGNDIINERHSGVHNIDAGAGDDAVSIAYEYSGASIGTILGGSGFDTLKFNAVELYGLDIGGFEVLEAANRTILTTAAQLDQFDVILPNWIGPFRILSFWLDFATGPQIADLSDEFNSGGSPPAVSLSGSGYDDTLTLGDADDQLTGFFGDDTLDGGLGDDFIQGLDGTDTVSYASATAGVTVRLALDGIAQNTGGGGTDMIKTCENITGSQFADSLSGDGMANVIKGGLANDALDGGLGDDRLYGEAGDDIYLAVDTGDAVIEAANQGADTVHAIAASYTLAANVERLIFAGTGNFTGRGNSLGNTIQGGLGDDLLIADAGGADNFAGLGGTDTMDFRASALGAAVNVATGVHGGAAAGDSFSSIEIFWGSDTAGDAFRGDSGNQFFEGYGGNDVIHGGGGGDIIGGGAGNDTWLGGETGSDAIKGGLGNDRIDGGDSIDTLNGDAGNDTVTGGDGDDTANGGDGDDTIYGQAGRDRLTGGLGSDTLYGGDETGAGDILLAGDGGNDHVQGGLGNDRIDGGTENDKLYGEGGNDTITGGLGNDQLEGGADPDVLRGDDGDDYLLGGDGADTLYGGLGLDRLYGNAGDDFVQGEAGNDNLYGGLGSDRFNFDPGNGSDAIFDFTNNQDTLIIDPSFGLANAAAVLAVTIQTGNHARILLPGAGTDIYLWDYLAPGSGNTIGNLSDDISIA